MYAILGRMSLTAGLFEPIIPRTIGEQGNLGKFRCPCHCSGYELSMKWPKICSVLACKIMSAPAIFFDCLG